MLELPAQVRDAICAHAREGYPHEVCGVLVGAMHGVAAPARREVKLARRARNAAVARPHDRFQLDPRDLVAADAAARARGLEIVGFYHSHPDRPAVASRTDLEETSPWGGYSYPIVSVVGGAAVALRSWARQGDAWVEETLTVV